jgi:peptide/nickel transport system permease protein
MASTAAAAPPTRSSRSRFLTRAVRNPMGVIAVLVLVTLYLLAIFGPLLYRISPEETDALGILASPSARHWLGTDELGRDVFARLLAGGRVSLAVGLISMLIGLIIGMLVGGAAGYFRGSTEAVLMRLVDVFLAIPSFFLLLVIVTVIGSGPVTVVFAVGLVFWPSMARIVFAEFAKYEGREFVEAMHALGASHTRIMFRHILPQVLPQAVVLATLGVGWAILTEAALSYIGLGIQPPLASWGNMLQNSQAYLYSNPMLAVYPGIAIGVTVLAFNLLGNALRDLLDPRN